MNNPNDYMNYTTTTNGWGTCIGPDHYVGINYNVFQPGAAEIKQSLKEGIEMKNLYEVFLVYGEDRKAPVISATERVIANDDEDARVKSGIYSKVDKEWDADYLTILVRNLGAVKIKERAKEVKNV